MQKVSYTGDGSTTEFTFNFPYYEDTNIIVTKNNETATGYTIIGTSGGLDADIPYTGGKVVFDTAPAILDTITIARYLPRTRSVDYQPLAKIDPTTLNQDMNYMMEVLKDMQDDLTTFKTQYESIVDKQETTQLLNKIDNVTEEMEDTNQNIEDFYQAVEDKHIMSTDMFYARATNCITEIPQNIKLELNNGTLTLKAGSTFYIPNGNGVFDKVTTVNDKTISVSTSTDRTVFLFNRGGLQTNQYPVYLAEDCYSGDTQPTGVGNYYVWYDTDTNTIKKTDDNGVNWDAERWSLPLAKLLILNSTLYIDQIFNGLGYIGSSVFALPGIKHLCPDGRGDDGTLKNKEYILDTVLTGKHTTDGAIFFYRKNAINSRPNYYVVKNLKEAEEINKNGLYYLINENKLMSWAGGSGTKYIDNYTYIGKIGCTDGNITNLNTQNALGIVNYNDIEFIGHQAMPSDTNCDITLGASNSTYIAPADGYYTISKQSTGSGEYLCIKNETNNMNVCTYPASGASGATFMPVSKGDVIKITYTLAGTTDHFCFVYANGSK